MPTPGWIRVVIALVAGAMFGLAALTGDTIDESGLRWIGAVTAAITLLLLGFDRVGFRWPLIRRVSAWMGAPIIHGTWRGVLHFERDQNGQSGRQPIHLAIHQTYSSVQVRAFFPTTGSESETLLAGLARDAHRHVLRYVYRTEVPTPNRDTNRPTEGTVELRVVGQPVVEMSGSYYAERNGARGTIETDGFATKVAGSAAEAVRLTYRGLPQE